MIQLLTWTVKTVLPAPGSGRDNAVRHRPRRRPTKHVVDSISYRQPIMLFPNIVASRCGPARFNETLGRLTLLGKCANCSQADLRLNTLCYAKQVDRSGVDGVMLHLHVPTPAHSHRITAL